MRGVLSAVAAVLLCVAPGYAQDTLAPVMGPYLKIQQMLAADSIAALGEHASEVSRAAGALGPKGAEIVSASKTLTGSGSLATARQAFSSLTTAIFKYADATKTPLGPGIRRTYCPMEKKSWAQKDGQIANPYAGKRMLRCGEFTDGKG